MSTSTAVPPHDTNEVNPETAMGLFSGSSRNPNEITTRIEDAIAKGNVLSPLTQCPNLPPFHEVAASAVKADCEVDTYGNPLRHGEIYKIGKNNYGLGKPLLNRIKRAVGVVWVPEKCGRIDDGSDPYFVRHFSFGVVQKFDGGIETIKGTKTLDLRDGSARVKVMIAKKIASAVMDLKYDAKEKNYKITEDKIRETRREAEQKAWDDINAMRAEIETRAETGSEMRALRSLGLKTSYTIQELQKPFIIFSLVVTGRHENPEFERLFAEKAADRALDVRRTLYGSMPTVPASVLNQPTDQRMPPPPIGTDSEEDDDLDDLGGPGPIIDVEAETPQTETEGARGSIDDAIEGAGTETRAKASNDPQPLVMPFGDHAGKYFDDSSIEISDLEFVKDFLVGAIANPAKAEHKLKNIALKTAIDVEIRRRKIPVDRRPPANEHSQAAQQAQNSARTQTAQTRTQTKSQRY